MLQIPARRQQLFLLIDASGFPVFPKHCATADMVERPTVIHLTRIACRFTIQQIDNDQRPRSFGGRVAATHLFSEPFLVTAT